MSVAKATAAPRPPAPAPRLPDSLFLDGRLYRPLFPGLFRPLTPAERQRLRDSLTADGLLVPIVIDDRQSSPGVIDGWHRLCLLVELGRENELRFDVRAALPLEKKRRLAVALNDARRQMSPADREQLVAVLRQQGHSTNAIAAQIGVSPTTVGRDLAAAGIPKPSHVTGLDGKRHPAAMPAPAALAARRAEVLRLHQEKCSVRQIAARLGISSGAVTKDLAAARLAAELKDLEANGLKDERGASDPLDKRPLALEKVRCPFCQKLFALPK